MEKFPGLLKIKKAAKILGVSTSYLRHLTNKGKIFSQVDESSKFRYYRREDLDEYIRVNGHHLKPTYTKASLMALCKNCGKEFPRHRNNLRKTCSRICYRARKASRSKDESLKELAHVLNSKIAGQTSVADHLSTTETIKKIDKLSIIDKRGFWQKIRRFIWGSS